MKVKRIKKRKMFKNILLACVFLGAGYYLKSMMTPNLAMMNRAPQTPVVMVQGLEKRDISLKKKFIAEVEAINSVDLVPQVTGYLQDIHFKEGAYVHQGDLLFVIEQSRFKANLQNAQASLEKAKSDYQQISSDYKRNLKLYREKVIPKATLEIAENKIAQAKSTVTQAQAAVELAEIELGYTEIRSPISGMIGKVLISKGNYVSPSSNLARIIQTDPVRVVFSISDKDRIEFLNRFRQKEKILFELVYPDGTLHEIDPQYIFMGNEINSGTATIPVYIDYQNKEMALLPGNYLDILVTIGGKKEALVVPMTSLAQDVNGTYVFVVNQESVVEQKYITLGNMLGDVQEVKSGLNSNDKVVVQGLQKVKQGSVVKAVPVVK